MNGCFSSWGWGLLIAGGLLQQNAERRLSSCRAQVQLLHSTWDLPCPGVEPVFPMWAGGFFTTEPPGKPNKGIYLQGKAKWLQQTPLKDAQDPGPAGLCGGCTERGALVPPRHRHLPEATTAQPRSPWGEHTVGGAHRGGSTPPEFTLRSLRTSWCHQRF